MPASLFDRLTDDNPRNSREAPPPVRDRRAAYMAGVARDLTNLLNTHRSEADIPEEFQETRRSLAAYGIQDFTPAPLETEVIYRAVDRAIRLFEPRLGRVHVTVVKTDGPTVILRILGVIWLDGEPEPVVYDAELPAESRRFQVTPSR
jgi:type VI secretion system lysozyme-like protein